MIVVIEHPTIHAGCCRVFSSRRHKLLPPACRRHWLRSTTPPPRSQHVLKQFNAYLKITPTMSPQAHEAKRSEHIWRLRAEEAMAAASHLEHDLQDIQEDIQRQVIKQGHKNHRVPLRLASHWSPHFVLVCSQTSPSRTLLSSNPSWGEDQPLDP